MLNLIKATNGKHSREAKPFPNFHTKCNCSNWQNKILLNFIFVQGVLIIPNMFVAKINVMVKSNN